MNDHIFTAIPTVPLYCYEEVTDFLVTFAVVQPVCPFVVSFIICDESDTQDLWRTC